MDLKVMNEQTGKSPVNVNTVVNTPHALGAVNN